MSDARASGGRRLGPRASLVVALTLAAIGVFRFGTDTLHEWNHDYWRQFDGTPLRYLIRAPSDGTIAGWLNAQWFKILSVPAGISAIYLRERLKATLRSSEDRDAPDWNMVRGLWTVLWFLGFTLLEFQKQYQWFGSRTQLVAGEAVWLNHVVHVLSAYLAWRLGAMFTFNHGVQSTPEHEAPSTPVASPPRP